MNSPKQIAEEAVMGLYTGPRSLTELARAYLALLAQVEGMRTEWGVSQRGGYLQFSDETQAQAAVEVGRFFNRKLVSRVIGEWKETK